MSSMLSTVWLILGAMSFGAMMDYGGFNNRLITPIIQRVKSDGATIATVMLTSVGFNIVAGDQYIAIVLPARMFMVDLSPARAAPEMLATAVENSGTVTSPLIPWNSCGAYMSAALGVSTFVYFPYCFFNFLNPLLGLVYGFAGINVQRLAPEAQPPLESCPKRRWWIREVSKGVYAMRIVVALGGNALLKRGEPMTHEVQRANIRVAAQALAPVAAEHELVLAHGNGPQVGLLALQASAYKEVEAYPLDVLGAQTEGMIGYMIEQELGNLLPFETPFATILTMVEVDPNDPAFQNPTKFVGPVYDKLRPTGSRPRKTGSSSRTAPNGGASCPHRCPNASSRFARFGGCWRKARSSSALAAAASRRCTIRPGIAG
jgi:hypothetical protein